MIGQELTTLVVIGNDWTRTYNFSGEERRCYMDNAAEKRLNHIFIVILRELECYFLTVGYSSCINKRHGSKTQDFIIHMWLSLPRGGCRKKNMH
jgi:hypothetical protein